MYYPLQRCFSLCVFLFASTPSFRITLVLRTLLTHTHFSMTPLFLNLDSSRDSFDEFQPTHPSTLKTASRTLKDAKSSAVMLKQQDRVSNPIRTELLDNLEVLHLSSARARYSRIKGGEAQGSDTTTEKWTNWNPTNPLSKEKKLYKVQNTKLSLHLL